MKLSKLKQKASSCLTAALLCCAAPLAMAADCNEPTFGHDIPDGKSASEAAMAQVQQAINQYIKDAESFIACVEANESRTLANVKRDKMLDAMEDLAADFNRQLRYYRRANS